MPPLAVTQTLAQRLLVLVLVLVLVLALVLVRVTPQLSRVVRGGGIAWARRCQHHAVAC